MATLIILYLVNKLKRLHQNTTVTIKKKPTDSWKMLF